MFQDKDDSLEAAKAFDQADVLGEFRSLFQFPKSPKGGESLYFAGHSLGLMPKQTPKVVAEEFENWSENGVEGHFKGKHPWLPYHENLTPSFARLVGAKENEVVAMNTLTVNLHLMLVSFYRPTKSKYKIMIENHTFPSDKYAVDSQARFHGHNPEEAVIELQAEPGEHTVDPDSVIAQIEANKDELALVMLGNCNYLSGQCFDFERIVKVCHENGIICGFNLAHGAGNLKLSLHDWNVDFAVWCTYKYLNSGPGSLAGAFVHEKHLDDPKIPRFEGWWGHNKRTRFEMPKIFDPLPTAEAWQLSNPPIFQLAAMRSSLELFDRATIDRLCEKRDKLTAYLEWLFEKNCEGFIEVQTPKASKERQTRGAMLCVRVKKDPKEMLETLGNEGVFIDFREPDILRMTPVPMYNSFEDAFRLVDMIKGFAT